MTTEKAKYRTMTIDREDMLALTRRMTVKRTSITRIAGAYMDPEGYVDGTFNTRFLKLSGSDKAKNLELAKTIPFAPTNRNLKRYVIPEGARGKKSLWQLLMGARSSGLENDALLDIFYDTGICQVSAVRVSSVWRVRVCSTSRAKPCWPP